jgi:predicted nucleotidyltransferase
VTRATASEIGTKALYDGRRLADWASEMAVLIAKQFDASRIVLFGSVARGDDGPDSDIDLLVVLPIVGRRHDVTVSVLTALRDVPAPVSIVVVDSTRFDEEATTPGIVRVAIREGKTLWQSTNVREQSADG